MAVRHDVTCQFLHKVLLHMNCSAFPACSWDIHGLPHGPRLRMASYVIVQAHDEKHVLLVLLRLAEIYTCNWMLQS